MLITENIIPSFARWSLWTFPAWMEMVALCDIPNFFKASSESQVGTERSRTKSPEGWTSISHSPFCPRFLRPVHSNGSRVNEIYQTRNWKGTLSSSSACRVSNFVENGRNTRVARESKDTWHACRVLAESRVTRPFRPIPYFSPHSHSTKISVVGQPWSV